MLFQRKPDPKLANRSIYLYNSDNFYGKEALYRNSLYVNPAARERLTSMKLPITNLNKVKRLSLKPFQKTTRELSSSQKASLGRTHQLDHSKREKSSCQIALTLLLVRPWVLVLGFWISSIGLGTLALGGMLSPRRLTKALPEPALSESADSKFADSEFAERSNSSADPLSAAARTEIASAEAAASATAEDTGSSPPNAVDRSQLSLTLPFILLISS